MALREYVTQDNLILATNALILVLFLILLYMFFHSMNLGPMVKQ